MIDNFHDIERFCEVARAEELDLTPENIVIDGPTSNRCHLIGERGKKNGAYHVYSDSVLAGWYQNHKGGEVKTWCSRSKDEIPRAEWDAIRARVAADQKKRAEELARARAEAAIKAREIWNKSALCTSHPYLTTKGVKSHGLRTTTRDYDLICSDGEHSMHVCAGALVIPAWDADENLHTVEFIDDGGNKLFMPAGHKQAHFFIIGYITGRAGERVVQVEGFGTGATVHESTDYPVVVAFDCGNQLPVAKAILEKYPQIDLAIVADDDWKAKTGNPGVTHATEAAKETGARLIIPRWSGERPEKSTDMDDLGRDEGRAEVKKQIDAGFSALKKTTTAEIWPDPEPLLGGMPDVPAFAAELLPVSLRDWIKDIAERLQCPIEYVAMTALSTLGSLIGRQCVIRPKRHDDWSIVANLWSAIVGPPSAMKSPAMAEALKPLRRLALKAAEDYAKAMKYHDADKAMAEAKRSAVKDKMKQAAKTNDKASDGQSLRDQFLAATEPQEIIQRRFSTSDSTTEKLGELLTENPNGLLVERDELVGFFRLLDRDGHEADRAFYLTAHDGTHPYIQDRIGRGTTFIPAVCVTISGGIQPGVSGAIHGRSYSRWCG